ncbi:hypothetical protein FIBSPDRAFT_889455 [Athelia psychrophila]|uniref:Zn(2)-C6 fungal-type domain-containing protein n=1 Tax=Athelia psychrophila TaxID=1759441 RepID=A0A166M468_9AGAM|nr:hypothetical protein FIBSPDRAFT_889455 [Fibularhizoctonia sp. CBS 109695]
MAQRAGTSRSTVSTARPRPHPEPKTSRRQFSATRRVACDLFKLQTSAPDGQAQKAVCSECRQRGMNCVDEYAAMKNATRSLRRGRRIQEIERLYGRASHPQESPSPPSSPTARTSGRGGPSIIPELDIAFFESGFFAAFILQYSLLDRHDFASRYIAHRKGGRPLPIEGQLLAKVLVVWAASFGVDPTGAEIPAGQEQYTSAGASTSAGTSVWHQDQSASLPTQTLPSRRERTDAQVLELLNAVDIHGVLRKPTWDGVRLLLLIWPLTVHVQTPLQRVSMYESTMSQVYALCSLDYDDDASSSAKMTSEQGMFGDAMMRARIFLYAHVNEGTINGLKGTRMVLSDDDLVGFYQTLPPPLPKGNGGGESSLPSPVSPSHPSVHHHTGFSNLEQNSSQQSSHAALAYSGTRHYFAPMLNLSDVCRHIHTVLTGPKAHRNREEYFDRDGLRDIWLGLDRSWQEFEQMRTDGIGPSGFSIGSENLDRFVSGWQIYIFECHNVIRKELMERVASFPESSQKASSSGASCASGSGASCSTTSSSGTPAQAMLHRYAHASRKCRALLPTVLFLVQRHVAPTGVHRFFAYDAGLVKGGCYFAGCMLARGELDNSPSQPELELGMDIKTGVQICLQALESMQCVYGNSKELAKEIRGFHKQRQAHAVEQHGGSRVPFTSYGYQYQPTTTTVPYTPSCPGPESMQPTGASTLPYPMSLSTRPLLAPVITSNLTEVVHRTAHAGASTWAMPSPPNTAHTQRSTPETHDEYPTSVPYYPSSDPHDDYSYTVPSGTLVPSPFELSVGIDLSEEFIDGVFTTVDIPHGQAPSNDLLTPPFNTFY